MQHKYHRYGTGTFIINVDSYQDGVLTGKYYYPHEGKSGQFFSLMQLVLSMEQIMDETDSPQAFQKKHTFSSLYFLNRDSESQVFSKGGRLASFSVHVIFRRNASWQGTVVWLEKGQSGNFRSMLELLLMIDRVVREKEMLAYLEKEMDISANMMAE